MKRTIFLLAGLGFALPAVASPTVPVKCGANQEKVWVYGNLTTWDVNIRLKCGTSVSVEGLEKGYVKILTADGNEGYVPADAIPSSELAQLEAADPASAPAPVSAVATAAPMQRAPQPVVAVAQPVSQPVSQAIAQPVQQSVAMVQTAPVARARVVSAPAPVATEAPVNVEPRPEAHAAPIEIAPPAVPAPAAPVAQQTRPAPTYTPAPAQAPVAARMQASAPRPAAPVQVAAAAAAEITIDVVATAPAPRAAAQPRPAQATVSVAPALRANPAPHAAQREEASLVIEPVATPASMATRQPTATVVKAADYTPLKKNSLLPGSMRDVYSDDEDSPEVTVKSGINLAACTTYFSAYGLTPMQFKWIAEDRSKRFPGVCPAPEPSMVDYVVIFTHDMDYFTNTLPEAIHTDKNGFSDWSPITPADDTMIPVSTLDKAHREYAWVFHVRRGSFDPSKFTEHRHPQFTKAESNARASSKSIEDAMQFISENGPSVSMNQ